MVFYGMRVLICMGLFDVPKSLGPRACQRGTYPSTVGDPNLLYSNLGCCASHATQAGLETVQPQCGTNSALPSSALYCGRLFHEVYR